MKNISIIFTLLFTLFLTGCGSNSKPDGGQALTLSEVVKLQGQEILQDTNGTNFTLTMPFEKLIPEAYHVELYGYSFEVAGDCAINTVTYNPGTKLVFDGGDGSIETLLVSGVFDANCTPTGYTLTATQKVTQNGQSDTRQVSFIVDYDDPNGGGGGTTPPPEDGYSFYNATTPLEITQPNTPYSIKVQLLKEGHTAEGETVKLRPIEDNNNFKYGKIESNTVSTGGDGYATFLYTSPATLPVNGTTITLTAEYFIDDNISTPIAPKEIVLNFNATDVVGDETLPVIVIPSDQKTVTLTSNSQTVELPINVYKNYAPYTEGSVKVSLPKKILNGTDVGQFNAYEVPVDEQGKATFVYTGPSNLQALINNDDNESIFTFYHEESGSENNQTWTVEYSVPSDPYISRNYELDVITSDEFSIGIPDKEKTFNVILKAKDSSGDDVALEEENITSITVTTTNGTVAQLLDTGSNTLVDNLSLTPVNNSAFILVSKDKSGLVPLEVAITFTDLNDVVQTLSTIINVRVFSGPPSAISISYVSTSQDAARAKYIEKLAISVTDEYGNKVNTKPNVTLGAIVGYAVDGSEADGNETNETRRLFYGKSDIDLGNANGEISNGGDSDPSTTTFTDSINSDVFRYVNAEGNNTDKLVIFGQRKNYEAMGKWDVELGGANNILVLQDQYYGIDRDGLYFAVGHNYYQDLCREDGREWIGTTTSETYQLDEEGTVIVDYRYDYHLTGKDALIWVNLDGYQPDTGKQIRIGEARKHTLRGNGLVTPNTYTVAAGDTTGMPLYFGIQHENAPEWYRNGHFGFAIEGKCTVNNVIRSSNYFYDVNGVPIAVKDARSCDNGGVAYVELNVTNPSTSDCTITLTNILVSDEF